MIEHDSHREKVQRIASQVRERVQAGQPLRFVTSDVSHLVPNPYQKKQRFPPINIGVLNEVLEIDGRAGVCVAEASTSFSHLVRQTLPLGLMPKLVPELKTITVGGAISGCSVESMSYKYGGFHDSCLEYEVITGQGEILTCSPQERPELFHQLHGSYGTLAIITAVRFQLIPAQPYVRMDYRVHTRFDDFWQDMRERCEQDDFDFVDGIIHAPDRLVLCLGTLVDRAPTPSRYEARDGHPFYYSTLERRQDRLTTYDYFFRYDADCHWLARGIPGLELRPVRRLLGGQFLGSSNMIRWSHRLQRVFRATQRRPDIVVDVFVPQQRFREFFDWYVADFDFFPLWIVPYRAPETYPWISDGWAAAMGGNFLIDCAIYGKQNREPDVDYDALLERKVMELGGLKTLISRNYYDEDTFWSIYSRPRWQAAKDLLDPDNALGGLYERFRPENYR